MREKKDGSILLLTLMVVSLLMVVTLAFTVFVRLNLKEVVTIQNQRQARSTSKLSLHLAIAQLQELTGPDTRITSPASLFDGQGTNVYQPSLLPADHQDHWTGVWDSQGFREDDMQEKPFLGWLVSGQQTDLGHVGTLSPDSSDPIELVSTGSVSDPEHHVIVAKESLASGGAYAWWSGDEGVKARLDLLDPWRTEADIELRQQSWTAGQRHAVERFFADPTHYPVDQQAFTQVIRRWLNLEHLPLSMSPLSAQLHEEYEDLIQGHFHEISLHSASVLANVKDGGLKRDLTQAFEMPRERFLDSEYASGSDIAMVPYYQPSGYPTGEEVAGLFSVTDFSPYGFQPEESPQWISEANEQTGPGTLEPEFLGPTWHLFRNYYRLYKSSDSDRSAYGLSASLGVQGVTGGSPEVVGRSFFPDVTALGDSRRYGQDPHTWMFVEDFKSGDQSDTHTVCRPISRPVHPGLGPILTRLQLVVSIRMRDAGDGIHMIPDLYLDPVLTLWNPYNTALLTGERNGQPLQISVKNFDIRLELDTDGDNGVELQQDFTTLLSLGESGEGTYYRNGEEAFLLNLDIPSGMRMEPGEFIILSPQQGHVVYDRDEQDSDNSGVVMTIEPGISYLPDDSGFYFENAFSTSLTRLMPDGTTPRRVRFRTQSVADNSKIRLLGVNRTSLPGGAFFSSLQGQMSDLVNLNWSTASYQVDSPDLTVEKHPFVIYEIHTKVGESADPVPLLRQFNPRAHVLEQGTYIEMDQTAYLEKEDLWHAYAEQLTDWNGSWLDTHGAHGAYGGSSLQSNRGRSHVALFEVPTRPLLSLGSLQHLPTGFFSDEPAFPIGNSVPSIFHRREESLTLQQLNPNNRLVQWGQPRTPSRADWTVTRPDWSYWLNGHLWDGYYFSGMVSDPQEYYRGDRIAGIAPLRPWLDTHQSPPDAAARLSDNTGLTQNADQVFSSQALLEGGFNINSTSVDAWKAVLSAGRNLTLISYGNRSVNAPGASFSRFGLPEENSLNTDWEGIRSLSDEQIDLLAEEIVHQVRIRGPFLNLSDFVNRRLVPLGDPLEELGAAGPLQAAIDASGINGGMGGNTLTDAGYQQGDIDNQRNPWIRQNLSALSNHPVAEGNTGSLTQADILTMISPLITPRSDTFRIRGYGETEDGLAKAWCEAIVQRVPAWQDSRRAPRTPPVWNPEDLPSPSGSYDTTLPRRQFRILSFRWLNPEDV